MWYSPVSHIPRKEVRGSTQKAERNLDGVLCQPLGHLEKTGRSSGMHHSLDDDRAYITTGHSLKLSARHYFTTTLFRSEIECGKSPRHWSAMELRNRRLPKSLSQVWHPWVRKLGAWRHLEPLSRSRSRTSIKPTLSLERKSSRRFCAVARLTAICLLQVGNYGAVYPLLCEGKRLWTLRE